MIDVNVGPVPVTVRLTPGDVTPLTLAVIVVVPGATPVARPRVAVALLMVANPVIEETHVADDVRF